MLMFLLLVGIAGMIVFHNFPGLVYLIAWYTLFVTVLFVEERIESRRK